MTALDLSLCHVVTDHARDVRGDAGAEFDVVAPASGDVIASVPDCDAVEAARIVDAVSGAFPDWRRRTAFERSAILQRWHDLIAARREEIAQLIALEVGKPIRQARGEVDYANAFISWNAGEILRYQGEILASTSTDQRQLVIPQPVGPAYGITPWNFPAAMVTRSVAPALAAGCSIALKPAEQSPVTALLLAQLWEEAGGPRDAFRVLTCRDPRPASAVLMDDPRIRKVTFTGSHEVGKILYREAAETMKAISLELGGHAPFLVFEDADVEIAAREAVNCKFRYGGQTCVCTNRIYVHESIRADFTAAYLQLTAELTVGDPLDEDTDIGPLIDEQGLAKVQRHVADAIAKGALIELGGRPRGGLYFDPTVLTGVGDGMAIMQEETFGPVAPLATFTGEAQAVRMANATPFGLAAYFWTRDVGRVFRLVDELEAGIIGANDGIPGGNAHAPFGGVKQSGVGRTGGRWGLEEYLEPHYVSLRLPAEGTS